jgi:solute carrier family 35 protein E4
MASETTLEKMNSTAGATGGGVNQQMMKTIVLVLLYLGLNSSLNLLNRYTLGHAGFSFPILLTCAHLSFSVLCLSPIMLSSKFSYASSHGEILPRVKSAVVKIGLFMSLNIAMNNASLVSMPLSLNQVIRASIPVVCAICAMFVEGRIPGGIESVGLVFVAGGVMFCISGSYAAASSGGGASANEREKTLSGLFYCVTATISNALMMTFSGKIMGGEKLDALRLTFYTAPVTLCALLPVALMIEGDRFVNKYFGAGAFEVQSREAIMYGDEYVSPFQVLTLVLLGCLNAVSYNFVHFALVGATSAVTTTVLGNIKVALLILCSRVLFGETKDWSLSMIFGAFVALIGFGLYSFARVKASHQQMSGGGKK